MATPVVVDSIRKAIAVGAPIYNAGDPGGCMNTYVHTALELVEKGAASEGERAALQDAVRRALEAGSKDEGAWIMRRSFDSILSGAVAAREAAARVAASVGPGGEFEVLNFEMGLPVAPRWRILDDVIMGGMSQSDGLTYDDAERAAVFSGRVTTDGGGGFASLRSDDWSGFTSLMAARGVRMMVQGDGRQYKLNAKTDGDYDGVQYQYDFTPPAGAWTQVELPFSGFKPTFRGRLVANRPPLQGQQIRQLGLMVSKFTSDGGVINNFRNGGFRLGIRYLRGFV
ncbi:hypothetical protein HYH02_005802 [Chlamydomonas schloesseri]|uniref:NADH:ubiquinone oxidoreductase intermediate-associated protein 30 domain-containing protein n=1 Tax=Chlamydomonas schloesseri TaxID=2026947 RepID=A0A835WJX4_9CHLO|nr:hypothetical protein HYH02_005802 [Chlamydomonas schloesseri]|eukprot:KAG2449053.1 hypothetical protein HYH02_005802 [Chlamydomonas schloesseri]